MFTSRDGALAGVVWVDDGVVTAVAGSLSADEVLSVARGLRWRGDRRRSRPPSSELLAELPPSPAVWCSGLRKRYGRQTAVDDVSFTVGRGEVVGLLGPNGAGKTSVIKILLGLVRPDAGEVLLLGGRRRDPHARARVGYLPELFRYQPWLTAAEVLALHVRLAGAAVPAAERRECLAWSASPTAPATGWAGSPRACSSGSGWPSRWWPGRSSSSWTSRPARWTRSAGPTSATCCSRSGARGVAVLLNSHLIGEVERVCDRVVILDKGRVAASGTLAELLGRRELRLRLDGVSAAGGGAAGRRRPRSPASGDAFTVALPADRGRRHRAGPRGRPGRARRARARRRARADQPRGAAAGHPARRPGR